jgi:hypothetical protein
MYLVQEPRQALNLVDDDNSVGARELLRHALRLLAPA